MSSERLRSLARAALHDDRALARLRRVELVDGAPVRLGEALGDADGARLDRRLRTLAAAAPAPPPTSASEARARAAEILAQERFHPSELPRPLRRLLEPLGRVLGPVVEFVARVWSSIVDAVPGGESVVWVVLGAIVVAAAAAVATTIARRRATAVPSGNGEARGGARLDPGELERRAEEAEAAQRLEEALRLRFVAGLLRLDRARAIRFSPSLTTHQVGRALRSADFDSVARTFDEVVYGRRPPGPDDVAAARSGWARVLEGVRR